MGLTWRATGSALLSALGALLFGLDIGYIGPILECASFKRDVAGITSPSEALPDTTVGFIVGIFSLGCVLTSVPCVSGYFMDVWGRRDSVIIGSAVFVVGCLVQGFAASVSTILVGRLVAGMSIGLLSAVVALYQSEVSPPSMRGALTSLYQLMITLGIVVACVADHYLVELEGGWRWAIFMQLIPSGALLVAMPFLPRSPRWLAQQGRQTEALRALESLRESQSEARDELTEIQAACSEAGEAGEVEFAELFAGMTGRLVAIGVVLQMMQQLVGMNAFMYFGPRIFGSLGLDQNRFQVMTSLVNFGATFPAIFLADGFGRRSLLLVGACAMAVACLAMGLAGFGAAGAELGDAAAVICVPMVFLFVASFAATWGPIVWVYCAEIFPQRNRSRCMGVATTANWVGNYFIAQATPVMLGRFGLGTFYVFGVFCMISIAFAVWLPETKGVPLEQMPAVFEARFGYRKGLCGGGVGEEGRPLLYGAASDAARQKAV
uniref:Hexose transporter 1 n=1 Tax=Zooxanthella nutricula TaxID=1333877 RepID=A0A7S2JXX6_9DINO|mmetsp:Transcript_38361/g.116014  ORF Transcript_38361/g.116014 Transcript_38361/m.116014 type:complete len:493 (+) Transcript_38361:100-1578(+)